MRCRGITDRRLIEQHDGRKKMRSIAVLLVALSLAACSKSVDEQFADACAEQKAAGGMYAETSKKMCQYGDELTAEQKAAAVQIWNDLKEAKARVEATKAEATE